MGRGVADTGCTVASLTVLSRPSNDPTNGDRVGGILD